MQRTHDIFVLLLLQIEVFLTITGIQSLDISSGKILAPGYLVASWTDELLSWNISDFDGLDRLSVSSDDIWVPGFVQFGSTDTHLTLTPAWLYSNGSATLILAGLVEGACRLDILKYPMDEHVCDFAANPRKHDTREIQLKAKEDADISLFTEHGEWEVIKSVPSTFITVEPISKINFTGVARSVTIRRRFQFAMVHTGVPLLLLSLLNVGVFLVPLRSGERITFSTSILLNLVFFTTKMSDDLPHNSLRISYCSTMMTTTNVVTTLGVIFSVILCRIDQETITPVPKKLQRFVTAFLACRFKSYRKKTQINTVKEINANDKDNISYIEQGDPIKTIHDVAKDIPKTWSSVAEVFDIILFDLSLAVFVIIAVVFSSLMFV